MSELYRPMTEEETEKCTEIINDMIKNDIFKAFVEPPKPSCKNQNDVFETPLCLKKILELLKSKNISTSNDFKRNVDSIFDNCKVYNEKNSIICLVTQHAQNKFESKFRRMNIPEVNAWRGRIYKCATALENTLDKMISILYNDT